MGDPVRCLPKVVHPDVAALKLQHNHHDHDASRSPPPLSRVGVESLASSSVRAAGVAGAGLERAQAIAGHESPRTTKLYDRTADEVTIEDIEKIGI